MFRLTLPLVRKGLLEHKRSLVGLALLSILIGTVPTVKAELEAGVIQTVGDFLRPTGAGPLDAVTVDQVLGTPVTRFATRSPDAPLPERIADWLLQGVTLLSAVAAYLAVAILTAVLAYGAAAIRARISKDLFSRLRAEAIRRGLRTDPSDIPSIQNAAGQYAAAVQQGSSNIGNTYSYLLDAGQYLFALGTTIGLVATKSGAFAIAIVILVGAQVAVSVQQARRLESRRKQLDRQRNALMGQTDDILSKRDLLVAYEQQDIYSAKLDGLTRQYAEVDRDLAVREERFRGISQLITEIGRIALLLVALVLAMLVGRTEVANIGDAYFLIAIYYRIFSPASNLLMRYDAIRRSEAESETYLDLLDAHSMAVTSSAAEPLEARWVPKQDIGFEDVSFAYAAGEADVLRNCTFTIPGSRTTLLLGPSGCGKTTVARIILKFWPVTRGSVTIGGRPLSAFAPHEVRARLSYVSQSDYIVDETIGENLRWGASEQEVDDETLRRLLASVGIGEIPGYDDALAAPARLLSGGQQQRLSVARMMLDTSEIVILDEPFVGVDVFTFREVLPQLRSLLQEREHTVLLISHRLAFVSAADHVIVLSGEGRVLEEGSPGGLLRKGGVFASLHAAAAEELRLPT